MGDVIDIHDWRRLRCLLVMVEYQRLRLQAARTDTEILAALRGLNAIREMVHDDGDSTEDETHEHSN
jgi:hypothetical protein